MVCVIGDIHGCYHTLSKLIGKIRENYPNVPLYCVGDLVDRGRFSYEVMESVILHKIKFTPGNHDYMFLYYMKDPKSSISQTWLYNGYESTMASYNGRSAKMDEHLELIRKAPLFLDLEDCFISHAGISAAYENFLPPDFREDLSTLKEVVYNDIEDDRGILWTREQLLDLGKLQVVGHTRRDEVVHSMVNNVLYIDTSVYTGNKLSAVVINDNEVIDILSEPTNREDLQAK
jgi:serine/threonine protein phosphatase 1